jgi:AraC-like DNA-binding protein
MLESSDAPASVERATEQTALRNIATICKFIAERFRDDIDSDAIAHSARIHPKYAMQSFKRSTGMTLSEYVSLMRLSYAQALLATDDRNILTVAMDSGLGSLSSFNATFRKIAGVSPTTYRREIRARVTRPVHS